MLASDNTVVALLFELTSMVAWAELFISAVRVKKYRKSLKEVQ